MPKPTVVVDYSRCAPENCERGRCIAVSACPRKVLKQIDPYEPPYVEARLCVGCGDCCEACPAKAIRLL